MMKTELVFILDRSGSMSGLEEDTIAGFNTMLDKQCKEKGKATITTVLFDDELELIHDQVDVKKVEKLTSKDYYVRGTTALLDAIGITLNKTITKMKNTKKKERADKVMFVIITDGMENASREYDHQKVKAMIDKQKEKYNWEFIFMGANIDAVRTASMFGIHSNRSVNYHADEVGTKLNFQVVNDVISKMRVTSKINDEWKEKIEKDFKTRAAK